MNCGTLTAIFVVLVALLIGVFLSKAPATPPLIEATVRSSVSDIRKAFSADELACDKRDWNNNTALHFAAKSGSILLIDELIQPRSNDQSNKPRGCDVSALNAANTSVLHWAAASQSDDPIVIRHLLTINQSNKHTINQALLYHLNARNESVLHWAVEWKSHQILDELLRVIKATKSDSSPVIDLINHPDENGDTPLHRLTIDCGSDPACRAVAASLIRAGANSTAENHSHRTPLQRINFDQSDNQSHNQSAEQLMHSADEFRRNLTDQFHTI